MKQSARSYFSGSGIAGDSVTDDHLLAEWNRYYAVQRWPAPYIARQVRQVSEEDRRDIDFDDAWDAILEGIIQVRYRIPRGGEVQRSRCTARGAGCDGALGITRRGDAAPRLPRAIPLRTRRHET